MEKYARQGVSEGVKNVEELRVGGDSEIYRVLNLHYNRNNHIEVSSMIRHTCDTTIVATITISRKTRNAFNSVKKEKNTHTHTKKLK